MPNRIIPSELLAMSTRRPLKPAPPVPGYEFIKLPEWLPGM